MIFDQAEGLRRKVLKSRNEEKIEASNKKTKIITVTSGKGGVGKSNFTLNFALALQDYHHRVAILDADIGLANIDVLMGLTPKYNLQDMMAEKLSIWDIMEKGPKGIDFIAGGSNLDYLLDPHKNDLAYMFYQFQMLNGYVDTIMIDTGAGLSKESLKFILSSDEIFLVTTPEPTAITDAYAIIKTLNSKSKNIKISLIINRVTTKEEGINTFHRIKAVAKKFLEVNIHLFGFIYDDNHVTMAVKKQEPFYISFPNGRAAKSLNTLAEKYLKEREVEIIHPKKDAPGIRSFIEKMTYWIKQ